jgi:hypothetical protein
MIHVLLPEQYLRKAGTHRIEPQKRLMLAVLQTAVDDCLGSRTRQARGLPRPGRKEHEDARAYVESTDRSWPFTFENLCEAIGLDAGWLRRRLTQRTLLLDDVEETP